jgi:hypothetical protein
MIFWARGMLSRRNFLYRVEYNWVQRLGSLLIISNSMPGDCAGGAKKKSDPGLNFFLIKKNSIKAQTHKLHVHATAARR